MRKATKPDTFKKLKKPRADAISKQLQRDANAIAIEMAAITPDASLKQSKQLTKGEKDLLTRYVLTNSSLSAEMKKTAIAEFERSFGFGKNKRKKINDLTTTFQKFANGVNSNEEHLSYINAALERTEQIMNGVRDKLAPYQVSASSIEHGIKRLEVIASQCNDDCNGTCICCITQQSGKERKGPGRPEGATSSKKRSRVESVSEEDGPI